MFVPKVTKSAAKQTADPTRPMRLGFQGKSQDRANVAPPIHGVGGVDALVLRSPGEPLAPEVRNEAERRFGRDFGNVRVHTGPQTSGAVAAVGKIRPTGCDCQQC